MQISLTNPSGRNTKAHIVTIGEHEYFFSYETCIAYSGPAYPRGVRIGNSWGPTTGRHFNELGCAGFMQVIDELFEEIVAKAVGG